MTLILRKNLFRCLLILCNYHEPHGRIDLFHVFNCIKPILPVQEKLRAACVFSAAHIDYAKIVRCILIGLSLFFYMEPVLNLMSVLLKIGLILEIPVDQCIILNIKEPRVRT